MSQGNWGGPPPGGGWGGGPGAPPGGGGYGPPGGGGYGAPPGGGGYGPPPGGGGYGAPPGVGGYGPPPNDFGAPPGAMAPIGARAQFNGEGGNLLVTFLMWGIGPAVVGASVAGAMFGLGYAVDGPTYVRGHHHDPGALFYLLGAVGMFVYLAIAIVGGLIFANKFIAFRFDNLVLDGQRCEYKGTTGDLVKVYLIVALLCAVTFGIYTPWAWCRMYRFMYEHTHVNGQPARLTFTGDGADLLGRYILGSILTMCTFGLYGAWFANDIFAFIWEGTKLDGRGFGFRRDPGGFLGTYLLTVVLTSCTGGVYYPWGICNILKWEAERVA